MLSSRSNQRDVFLAACGQNLSAAKEAACMITILQQDYDMLDWTLAEGLVKACEANLPKVAQWIYSAHNLHAEKAAMADAMEHACRNGNMEMAKWLAVEVGLTSENLRYNYGVTLCENYRAFSIACYKGHEKIAKWFAKFYRLSREEVQAGNTPALALACVGGHLKIAKWLYMRYKLDTRDLGVGASSSHAHIIEWINSLN